MGGHDPAEEELATRFEQHRGMRSFDDEPIDVTVSSDARDPRAPERNVPGVRIHYTPELHPDDVTVLDGVPVTSVS